MSNESTSSEHRPYVFITVGTTDFDALVRAVDTSTWIDGYTGAFQIGEGSHEPTSLPFVRFAPSLDPYFDNADVVVSHGGMATTMEVLRRGLPLVSVSNDDRRDGHQDDILSELEAGGHLVWCRSLDEIGAAVERAATTELQPYREPESTIHEVVEDFLGREHRPWFSNLRRLAPGGGRTASPKAS